MKSFYNSNQLNTLDNNQIILNAIQVLEQSTVNRHSSYNETLKQALRLTDHFQRLSHRNDFEELLSQTVSNINYKVYKAGTPIYHQGQKGNRICFILTGQIALYQLKSHEEMQNELYWVQKQNSKQSILKNYQNYKYNPNLTKTYIKQQSNERIRGNSEIKDYYTSKFDEELIKKNSKNEQIYFRQYQEQGYICKLKRAHTLYKLQSFGNINSQMQLYEHTSIAEFDSIVCYTYISKYDKHFQELFGHIQSSINYMQEHLPKLSQEELKQICYKIQIKQYSYQDIVYKEFDQNDCFYIVKSGLIDVYKENFTPIKDNFVSDSRILNNTKSFDKSLNSLSHISQIQEQERVYIKTLNPGDIFGNEDFYKGNYRYFKTICSSLNAELYEISLSQIFKDTKQSIHIQKEFKRKSLIQLSDFMGKLSTKLEELGLNSEASICNMDISFSSLSPQSKIQNSFQKRRINNKCQSQIDFSQVFNNHKRNESNNLENNEAASFLLCSPDLSPIKKNSQQIPDSPTFSKCVSFKDQSQNQNNSTISTISTQDQNKQRKLDISPIKSSIKLRSFLSSNKTETCPEESLNFSRCSNINNTSYIHSVNKSQETTKNKSIQLLDAQFFRNRQKQQSCLIGQQDQDKSILSPIKLQLNHSFIRNRSRQISSIACQQENEKSLMNKSSININEGQKKQLDLMNTVRGNDSFLLNFKIQSPKKASQQILNTSSYLPLKSEQTNISFIKFQVDSFNDNNTITQLQKSPIKNEKEKLRVQSPKIKLYERISQGLQNKSTSYKMMNIFKKHNE